MNLIFHWKLNHNFHINQKGMSEASIVPISPFPMLSNNPYLQTVTTSTTHKEILILAI